MPFSDDWGRDPQVRAMRFIFAALEQAQEAFLSQAGIDPWMQSLDRIRFRARDWFERAWPMALERGQAREPDQASALYLLCLKQALLAEGIDPAPSLPPEAGPMQDLLERVLKRASGKGQSSP